MNFYGIDIGKENIHVSRAEGANPKKFPVTVIEYANPRWWADLHALIIAPAVVCAEPTGWHYLQPVVTALNLIGGDVQLYQVNHQQTAAARHLFASAKNDAIDARALAFIARQHIEVQEINGVKRYNQFRHQSAQSLRLLLNEHRRLTKQSTRRLNQLDALGHSIWPALAIKRDTWLKLVKYNAISPQEIIAFMDQGAEEANGNERRWMRELVKLLHPVDCHPMVKDNVRRAARALRQIQSEIADIEEEIIVRVHQPIFKNLTERWLTVPHLGEVGIAALIVATNGEAEMLTPNQFVAAVGCAPQTGISGSIDRTRAGKKGYRPAKDTIFWCVTTMLNPKNPDNPIRQYFVEGNAPACRRKLARILSAIARNPEGAWKP